MCVPLKEEDIYTERESSVFYINKPLEAFAGVAYSREQGLSALSSHIAFTIPLTPTAKGRARSFIRGGHVGHFTPQKTVVYENVVAHCASIAMGSEKPLDGPVSLLMEAYLPIPASWSKKRQEAALMGFEKPAKKPDLDNLVKSVTDGMNGIVWKDDSQVVVICCSKSYSDRPRTEVRVGVVL